MKVIELARKEEDGRTVYGLGVITIIDAGHPIQSQIRHVNEALINWFKSRGSSCAMVNLVYGANPSEDERIMEYTADVVNQDFEYAPIMRSLEITVFLLDEEGNQRREFRITQAVDG